MEVVAVEKLTRLCGALCSVVHAGESWPAQRVVYAAGTLGLVLLAEGRCTVEQTGRGWVQTTALTETPELAADAAGGGAGSLFLTPLPFALEPLEPCHCFCLTLDGEGPAALAAGLTGPTVQAGDAYPGLAAMLSTLCDAAAPLSHRRQCAMALELLTMLEPDAAADAGWPALVQAAVRLIRTRYGSLYGVEELAEALGVTKSHLVRTFHAALGQTPGQYLTATRIEAACQLLARGHTLEVVATLCGFSGANYLCKVFKKAMGISPSQYRRSVRPEGAAPLADAAEQQLFL